MKRCRNVGFQRSAHLHILSRSTFLRARRGVRAATTIFHVSGWPARRRPTPAAGCGWFHCGRWRYFLSLGSVQSRFGQVVAWICFDYKRHSCGDRISHADCRTLGWAMFPRDRFFMVSRAFLECERRQAGGFWNDHYGCRDWITRAGGVFPRWPLVWTAGNCDSALLAPARIVTDCDSRANSQIRSTGLFVRRCLHQPKVVFRVSP